MFKKLIFSLASASVLLVLTILLGKLLYVEPAQIPGFVGDNPPAWWSRGLPLSIIDYQDCPSGCIPVISPLYIATDLIFWFILSFIVIKKQLVKWFSPPE